MGNTDRDYDPPGVPSEPPSQMFRSQSDQRLIEVYRDLEYTVRMILDGPAYDDNEGMLRVALEKLDEAKAEQPQ